MLDAKLETALSEQINHEITAAYQYLAMRAWFEAKNLSGFAAWMTRQRQEELIHADRLLNYLLDRGGKLTLNPIAAPTSQFKAIRAVFDKALDLEKTNTREINELYALATELRDYATQSHLQWFLDEQVEEEKSIEQILALLDLAGDNPSALLILNNQLANREEPRGAAEV